MGGFGSGRSNGLPLAEDALRLDLTELLRRQLLRPGQCSTGSLGWSFSLTAVAYNLIRLPKLLAQAA